jgi:drug/metabolite transporter (DMT)-like permease
MTLTTFLLVILAALIHATWNLLAKKAGGGAAFVLLGNIVVMTLYSPVIAIWWWHTPGLIAAITPTQWFFLSISAVVHIGYSLSLQRGYQLADYGVVYPVARGTGPLLSSIIAIVFLGETVTLFSGLGILAIVAGIFVLAGGARALADHTERSRAGVRWGLTTGLFIAAYTAIDGYSVKFLALSPLLLDYFSNLLRTVFMLPLFVRNHRSVVDEWRKNGRYALAIGAVSPLAYILVLYAMQSAPISHVAPLRELSMLFAAAFGARLLKEKQLGEKMIGATLMVAGVVGLLWR